MSKTLFREKNLQKISSPEDIDSYIKTTTPAVWVLLSAILLLIVGTVIWGFFGSIETVVPSVVVSRDGQSLCFIPEESYDALSEASRLRLQEKELPLLQVAPTPVPAAEALPAYALHLSGFTEEEWIYPALPSTVSLPDGVYPAEILVDSMSPISFYFK